MQVRKNRFAVLGAVLAGVLLFGTTFCRMPASAEELHVLKLAVDFPDESVPERSVRLLQNDFYIGTDRTIYIHNYSAGTLGTAETILAGLQNKRVELALLDLEDLTELTDGCNLIPESAACETAEEVLELLRGEEATAFRQIMEEQGIHVLGFLWDGFRELWSTEILEKEENLVGMNINTTQSETTNDRFRELGCALREVTDDELLLSVMCDELQLFIADEDTVILNMLYPYVECYVQMDCGYSVGVLMISSQVWQELDEKEQQILENTVREVEDYALSLYELQHKNWNNLLEREKIAAIREFE